MFRSEPDFKTHVQNIIWSIPPLPVLDVFQPLRNLTTTSAANIFGMKCDAYNPEMALEITKKRLSYNLK